MIIKTKNSTYEFEDGKFRKIAGVVRPDNHPHPVPDDEWQPYHCFAVQPRVGNGCTILLDKNGDQAVYTSKVVSIDDDDGNFGWVSATSPDDIEWN